MNHILLPKYTLIEMRTRTLILLMVVIPFFAFSQPAKLDRSAISARVMAIDYGTPNDADLSTTFGLEIAYRYLLNRNIGLAVPLKFGVADVAEDLSNRNITSLDLLVQFYPLGSHNKIAPYAFGGIGYVAETLDEGNAQIPLGLGLNILMGANSFLTIKGEYRASTQDNRDNIHLGLGYLYQFGQTDTDGDGVMDVDDACPNIFGQARTNGCPDTDNDGIANKQDACPEDAGPIETNGCPDADGDGVWDNKDSCPDEAGLVNLNGCPDADEDGVADVNDLCPEVAGNIAMGGCPDTDGDLIHDGIDACPNEPGTEAGNGCPFADADGDGVIDEEDMCPETVGLKSMKGCPDADGDHVIDSEDRCPNTPGPYTGCPDTDGDGVIDADDRCPEEAGLLTNKGCPEIREDVREVLELAMRAVQFESNSAKLKEGSYAILDQITAVMAEHSAYKLRISGHTDNVGDPIQNQFLSEQRANACYEYLKASGVREAMLSYAGYGEDYPLTSNGSSSGRLLNRRVEFDLIIE